MRLFILFVLLNLLSIPQVFSQRKILKQVVQNRITINTPDSTTIAMVYPDKEYKKIEDDKLYYWYKANKIKREILKKDLKQALGKPGI